MNRRLGALGVAAFLASLAVVLAPSPSGAASSFYFHGTTADQANKVNGTPTATWDGNPPTGTVPVTQSTTGVANSDFAGNPLGAYWQAPFSGTLSGGIRLDWWWTGNAEAQVSGLAMGVSIFADPDGNGNGTLVGRATANLNVGPAPVENVNVVPVGGTVSKTLLIQATAAFTDTGSGTQVYYDSTSTPSGFSFVAIPAPPAVAFDTTTQISFAPATVVSPTFLGGEPETTMEHPVNGAQSGRIDPNRIFVDWPLSSRTQTSQVSRSTNGGDSFRMLLDVTTCPQRDRPDCASGGGGDSKTDVNLYNGNLFFADQEVLANEALASSTDHGDTWPATRQFAITNAATGVDRQWLAYIDPKVVSAAPGDPVEGFLSYHIPVAGEYIQGIDSNGVPVTQPAPQITGVTQSGSLRVDNSNGPAHGWIYQPYRGGGGVMVGTAPAPGWQNPTNWQSTIVSADNALVFPWIDIDTSGNAFMVWVNSSGILSMSESPIQDARNNPSAKGRPGSYWTPQVALNPPGVGSTVFPEVRAGDLGRIAIAFMGSTDCTGQPDNCADSTHWNTYTEFLPDALAVARGTTLTVESGIVNHRIDHRGNICTSGTTCTTTGKDRSLLDMLDLGFDANGRVGVVFMDNNNRLAAPNITDSTKNGPFTMFAKVTQGPSLLAGQSSFNISVPQNSRTSAAGDATWPNTANGVNLKSLDLLGASLSLSPDGSQVIARVPLGDATLAGMARDLNTYNSSTTQAGARVQYVVRWSSGDDLWHLDMDYTPSSGAVRFFGGKVDADDGVTNGTGTVVAARYVADAGFNVSGGLSNGVLTLAAPASQFNLASGTPVVSVTAFAQAGPTESDPTATTIANSMRTIDATPPFDGAVTPQPIPATSIDCTDKSISESGGWHTLSEAGAGNGTLCRVVGGGGSAWMSVPFSGSGIDLVTATGPRGGDFKVSIDGAVVGKVSDFRPPTNPTKPDMTGRNDLTFGVVHHWDVSEGPHTLRIDILDDSGVSTQNMDYVDGFNIYAGFTTGTGGSPQAVSQLVSSLLGPLVDTSQTILATATSIDIDAIVQAVPGVTVTITDPTGKVVAQGTVQDGVVALRFPTNGQVGAFVVDIHNPTSAGQPIDLWEVVEGK